MARPKGQPKLGGRQLGTPNKVTREAKEAIAEAFNRIGGVDRLEAWIREDKKNETLFLTSIWPKIIPLQVNSNVDFVDRTEAVRRAREEVRELFGDRTGSGSGDSGRGLPH